MQEVHSVLAAECRRRQLSQDQCFEERQRECVFAISVSFLLLINTTTATAAAATTTSNTNTNNRINIASYSRKFKGVGDRSDQCSVKPERIEKFSA